MTYSPMYSRRSMRHGTLSRKQQPKKFSKWVIAGDIQTMPDVMPVKLGLRVPCFTAIQYRRAKSFCLVQFSFQFFGDKLQISP